MGRPAIDLIGMKFGRLLVLGKVKSPLGYISRRCKCDCGNEKIAYGGYLREHLVKSCGCLAKDTKSRLRHGLSKTIFHKRWSSMLDRCKYKQKQYASYYTKGISICDRRMVFENFRDDMYESYLDHCKLFGENNTSLDRIDNDGNYCKDNCKRSTLKEQQNNKDNTLFIEYGGYRLTLDGRCKKTGLTRDAIYGRLRKGYDIKAVLYGICVKNKGLRIPGDNILYKRKINEKK